MTAPIIAPPRSIAGIVMAIGLVLAFTIGAFILIGWVR
jgi:hypothetical protein